MNSPLVEAPAPSEAGLESGGHAKGVASRW
jgi:hypothetical protein